MSTILKLTHIRIDGGTQVRVEIDQATVDEYAEAFEAGVKFPPLTVYGDGAAYWLADGFHRYHAARKAGVVAVACDVHRGTVAEARWAAIGANVAHGLRRSNADKQNAVKLALELHPELSDEVIAGHAGVHRETVLQARRQVVGIRQPDHRIGKDGKSYPAPPQRPAVPTVPPTSEPRKPALPPPPTPPAAPEGPRDGLGRSIPPQLVAMWERRAEVEALKSKVSEVRVALRKARESGDPLFAGMPQESLTWLDNAYSELDNAKPYAVCPWCGGLSKSCRMCHGPARGFVSEFQWKTFSTPELREASKLAAKK